MKMKIMEKPSYPEMEIVAKTVNGTECGTIDRKVISRVLLTLEAAEKDYQVVGGDGVGIKTVQEFEEFEVKVEFVGGIKSLASFKFYKGYKAENRENAGVTDLYTTEVEKIEKLRDCAFRMSEAHPECDRQWKIVDNNGKRVFLRAICKSLKNNGMIEG